MTSMLGPALRMLVSLAVVLALMYFAARLLGRSKGISPARRSGKPARAGSPLRAALANSVPRVKRGRRVTRRPMQLEVVARQPLGKAASLAVVRVADRTLLLGVTDTAVQLLTEMDAALLEEVEEVEELESTEVAQFAQPSTPPARNTVSVLDLLRERTVRRA
jgi:flagellar protein FliO/FliZ